MAAAALLLSLDRVAALFLLALDDLLDAAVLDSARLRTQAFFQSAGDGTAAQLMYALSSGALPGGTADDDDGFAPVGACGPACQCASLP